MPTFLSSLFSYTNFSMRPVAIEEDLDMLPLFQCSMEGVDIFTINSVLTMVNNYNKKSIQKTQFS